MDTERKARTARKGVKMSTKLIRSSERLQVPFDRGVDYYLEPGVALEVPLQLAKTLVESNPSVVHYVAKKEIDPADPDEFDSNASTLFVECGQVRSEVSFVDTSREILAALVGLTEEDGPLLKRQEKIAQWEQYLRAIQEQAGHYRVSYHYYGPSDDIAALVSRLIELLKREIDDEEAKFTL